MKRRLGAVWIFLLALCGGAAAQGTSEKKPPLKLVDLGGHRLHVNCSGKGKPTVVVENGLGDFSFDWLLVQERVSKFARICTYDRAGYAWSDPGPKPRTFAQINLELHDALKKIGEKRPYVLVGHSFGGPVVRQFAMTYPRDVAGVVFVDAAFEGMRVGVGGNKTMKLGEDAKGKTIPDPREEMQDSDKPMVSADAQPQGPNELDPMYKVLPEAIQQLQLWAQALPQTEDAEGSQREWSSEYFAKWMKTPQTGTLGNVPVIVMTRAQGGYADADVSATQLEKERKEGQAMLVKLSTNSRQIIVNSGHNMEVEASDEVTAAIRSVVEAVRKAGKL